MRGQLCPAAKCTLGHPRQKQCASLLPKSAGASLGLHELLSVMYFPAAAAMESYSRAYPHLIKLHMLQEIADVAGAASSWPAF